MNAKYSLEDGVDVLAVWFHHGSKLQKSGEYE